MTGPSPTKASRKQAQQEHVALAPRDRSQAARKKILVAGDWVVDDFWVVGVHRSATSSRTGRSHLRAQHTPQSCIRAFCGAGRTASLLHNAHHEGASPFEIVGLGLWHPDDTDLLRDMFEPANLVGQTPFRVRGREASGLPDRVHLVNLASRLGAEAPLHGTTRVIRIFQHTGATVSMLERIDWELEAPRDNSGRPAWIRQQKMLEGLELELQNSGPIEAVVIKDLGKGVASDLLVQWLSRRFRKQGGQDVPWFVSTKSWRPRWFEALKGVDLRLLIVPEIAAKEAMLSKQFPGWISVANRPTREALDKIRELGKNLNTRSRLRLVVLPEGLHALACDFRPERDRTMGVLYVDPGFESPANRAASHVNMASVCFAALVGHLLEEPEIGINALLRRSLSYTRAWQLEEIERFTDPEGWEPRSVKPLSLPVHEDIEPRISPHEFVVDDEILQWRQALSGFGIIRGTRGDQYLELWRAMSEVDGYVCCVPLKKENVRKLVRGVRAFKHGDRSNQISCLLFARPGSGKTFLVRRLAESLGLRFLSFNVTQMIGRRDILDCFDTIVTGQAQNPNEPLLVFFDEINAKLDSQHVYSAFLAPLEDGVYVRAGKVFHIAPCAWIFASTAGIEEIRTSTEKGSDLVSRLTLGQIDIREAQGTQQGAGGPSSDGDTGGLDDQKLENVYIGVSMMKTMFPDVRYVSEEVLNALHRVPVGIPARELRHFVETFHNVQYGRVEPSNISKDRLGAVGLSQSDIDWKRVEPLIEIRTSSAVSGGKVGKRHAM